MRKEQSITQLSSRLSKTAKDLTTFQDRIKEERKVLTIREEELLKAKAEVSSAIGTEPHRLLCQGNDKPSWCRLVACKHTALLQGFSNCMHACARLHMLCQV